MKGIMVIVGGNAAVIFVIYVMIQVIAYATGAI